MRELAERLHQGLNGEELEIGVERVEIGIVFGERAAGLRGALGASRGAVVEALPFAGIVTGEHGGELLLIIGEIAVHVHVGGKRNDGDQIRGLHLLVNEFLRRVHRAVNLLGLHGGKVEEEEDQAAIASIERWRSFLAGVQ